MDLAKVLNDLPNNASEAIVSQNFVLPFLEALGYAKNLEIVPQFRVGSTKRVDFAAKRTNQDTSFTNAKLNPDLLVEVKGRESHPGCSMNLTYGTPQYLAAKLQLENYLLDSKCMSANWGILTNANHIQLFRKHGKVIFPTTACLSISPENIDKICKDIKVLIDTPAKALTVCIYNNKGGVGKTTTVINLAGALATKGKKVLVVDFDVNQKDLSNVLRIINSQTISLYDCLVNREYDVHMAIEPYSAKKYKMQEISFDVIPVNYCIDNSMDLSGKIQGGVTRLKDVLSLLINDYDYILIDTPPNWNFFSQSGIYASDVVLTPTQADNVSSLRNAAVAISSYVPEIQSLRNDGGPMPLHIFFNGGVLRSTIKSNAMKELKKIVEEVKTSHGFDLNPYFFKKGDVFHLPGHSSVSKSMFEGILGVLAHKTTDQHYKSLVLEYFLQ